MKRIIALAIMAILPVIAGCGNGGGGGTSVSTAAVLKISATPGTLPAGKVVVGLGATIELPAGVTVKTTAGGAVDPTVVVPSGVLGGAGNAAMGPVVYTPATATSKAKLDFAVASLVPAGVGEGEYVTITFILNGGVTPTAADFDITSFKPIDQSFADLPTVTPSKTVILQ